MSIAFRDKRFIWLAAIQCSIHNSGQRHRVPCLNLQPAYKSVYQKTFAHAHITMKHSHGFTMVEH